MRIEAGNPMTPGIIVILDGETVGGCVAADDVEGWVERLVRLEDHQTDPDDPHRHVRYRQGQNGEPITERVEGTVEFGMMKYAYDDRGNIIQDKTEQVPVDWDLYMQQRRRTFKSIHKGTVREREAIQALDEWYGKARSQDAQARAKQEQEKAEASGARDGAREEEEGDAGHPGSGEEATGDREAGAGATPEKSPGGASDPEDGTEDRA
jgi:hypothetical protein